MFILSFVLLLLSVERFSVARSDIKAIFYHGFVFLFKNKEFE